MSADVDQEIYDDALSLAGAKPEVKAKPANVKNIAAMFGGGGPPVSSKPVGKNNMAGSNKPVAVVPPSKTSEPSKVPMRGPKPGVKPLPKMNGEVKNNNNTVKPGGTSPVTGGKVALPGAFSKDSTSPDEKLNDIRISLKPVGGINSVQKKGMKDLSLNSTPSNQFPPSRSAPTKSPVNKTASSQATSPTTKSRPITDLCLLTSDDNCKFRLKTKPKVFGSAPTKPSKLTDVDLKAAVAALPPALPKRPIPKQPVNVGSDEVYDDVDSTRPVSEIKEYSAAEEDADISGGQVDQETYDDVGVAPPTPTRNQTVKSPGKNSVSSTSEGETYDDCNVEGSAEVEGEFEELYEALDDIQTNAKVVKDDKKEKKTKEQEKKEKKEKEKKEKEEKERQQKLEKEKKLWAKLNITGNEVPVSEGKVRETSKGGKLDLAVKKGQSVSIIRMTDCPQYKWVAKTHDGKAGYVEISNIEVMTGTLQNIKSDIQRDAASGEFEEVYDDVATAEDPDQDIYEDTI